jgi:hypothetical protein
VENRSKINGVENCGVIFDIIPHFWHIFGTLAFGAKKDA